MIYNNKPISYKEDTRTTEIFLKASLETIRSKNLNLKGEQVNVTPENLG